MTDGRRLEGRVIGKTAETTPHSGEAANNAG